MSVTLGWCNILKNITGEVRVEQLAWYEMQCGDHLVWARCLSYCAALHVHSFWNYPIFSFCFYSHELSFRWSNPLFFTLHLSAKIKCCTAPSRVSAKESTNSQRDYIPIKILAALIVIDMAEILTTTRANRGTCAWECTQTLLSGSVLYSNIRLPRRSGFCWGLLTASASPCVAVRVYQSYEAPLLHTEASCVTGAVVCTYAYCECGFSKQNQQVHSWMCWKDKKIIITKLCFKCLQSHCFHWQYNFLSNAILETDVLPSM